MLHKSKKGQLQSKKDVEFKEQKQNCHLQRAKHLQGKLEIIIDTWIVQKEHKMRLFNNEARNAQLAHARKPSISNCR